MAVAAFTIAIVGLSLGILNFLALVGHLGNKHGSS